MKIVIFYFSGTGNTKKIADLYKTSFEDGGAEVTMFDLMSEDAKSVDTAGYDLIGFGYPVHSFNAPANVLAFAKGLKKFPESKRAFIFKSSGEPVRMSDVSSLKLIKILKKRNIKVTNEYQYVMPYNMIFRHTDEAAYRMWSVAQKVAPIDCREILSGTPRLPKRVFMGGFLAWVMRIEHWGARFNGRFYKVNSDCVKCGLCVKTCPANNIKITEKGKVKFGGKCLMCVRCSFNCPKNAIKIGLFNGWKVNGAYTFAPPDPGAEKVKTKHDNYCRKAYDRYYKNAEEKIKKCEDEQISEFAPSAQN